MTDYRSATQFLYSVSFILRQNDPYRLRHHRGIIRDVCMDHGACSDLHPVSDMDIPDEHRPRTDETVISDHRRSSVYLADGHILIDPAALTHTGISGNKDPLQSVGKDRPAFDHCIRSDISPMTISTPAHKKGQHIMQKTAADLLLPPVQSPKMLQIAASGILYDLSSDTHSDLLIYGSVCMLSGATPKNKFSSGRRSGGIADRRTHGLMKIEARKFI